MRELLQIGEVARLVGVSTKTIRYYHEIGLLAEPERTGSGYRLYNAHHLLRLQRIRRLRSLGLSLERIRAILGDSAQDAESTLRAALHSLVEEISAQILELEERRTLLKALLVTDRLEPEEEGAFFLSDAAVKAQFAASLSVEALEWGQRVDALLGSFHWPVEFRQVFQSAMRQIAGQPGQYRHLLELEERFAALAHVPEDDPEVAQLARDYASSPELPLLWQQLAQVGSVEQGAFSSTFVELMSTAISPAQKRFFELLAQQPALKQLVNHSDSSPSPLTQSPAQEQ